jgi:hypothetical protein
MNSVNGLLQNPVRIAQFEKLCLKYNVALVKKPQDITYYSAYLSGLIDSDGSIDYNLISGQVFITVSQKNRFILNKLISLYGGQIYKHKNGEFSAAK